MVLNMGKMRIVTRTIVAGLVIGALSSHLFGADIFSRCQLPTMICANAVTATCPAPNLCIRTGTTGGSCLWSFSPVGCLFSGSCAGSCNDNLGGGCVLPGPGGSCN